MQVDGRTKETVAENIQGFVLTDKMESNMVIVWFWDHVVPFEIECLWWYRR